MKGTSLPGFTLHPHAATHKLGQTLADRQAQPGAPEEPRCGTVGLAKRFEKAILFIPGNTYTRIPHRKVQHSSSRAGPGRNYFDNHLALSRELHRVPGEIHQDLP